MAFEFHKLYCTDDEIKMIEEECPKAGIGCFECKKILLARIKERLAPIQEKRKKIMEKPDYISDVLNYGDKKAREKASETMEEVLSVMHLNY
jgi:tryptophanyl-tRNA synthetase